MTYFFLTCLLSSGLSLLVFSFIPAVGGKAARTIKRINRKRAPGGDRKGGFTYGYRQVVEAAASREKAAARYQAGGGAFGLMKRALSRCIILSGERRAVVEKKLLRAGYRVSPELFYADVILRTFAVLLLTPVFFYLDNKVAAAATVFLSVGLYYKWIGAPDERLRRIAASISDELPRFVSVLSYSMSTDRDLINAIERYIRIAKPALRNDLELLLLEMKAGSITEALKRFDARVGNPQLSVFVSGLIDAGRGVDQKTFFFLMEENMKLLFIENRKKELSRRPAKVKKAIISVGLCMFLLYLVPICMQLVEGLSMFK